MLTLSDNLGTHKCRGCLKSAWNCRPGSETLPFRSHFVNALHVFFFTTALSSLMNWSQKENELAFPEHGLTLMVTSPVWRLPCASYWHVLIPLLENLTIHGAVKTMRVSYSTFEGDLNKSFNTKSSCWCFSTAFCLDRGKFTGEGKGNEEGN